MANDRPHVPREAVDLYTQYIHGEIPRRAFLSGLSRFAVAGLTVNAIVNALMPDYVSAQQVSKTDERITASYVTVPSPQGNGSIKGYFVRPFSADTRTATPLKLPGVILVHENRGLNPHIEDLARRFALANFMAFAPDALTSVGGYPGNDLRGGELFGQVDTAKKFEDFVAATLWLKARSDCNGKVGITGFCYGGGVANGMAVRLGADLAAAAPFYGGAPPAAGSGRSTRLSLPEAGRRSCRPGRGARAGRSGRRARRARRGCRAPPPRRGRARGSGRRRAPSRGGARS